MKESIKNLILQFKLKIGKFDSLNLEDKLNTIEKMIDLFDLQIMMNEERRKFIAEKKEDLMRIQKQRKDGKLIKVKTDEWLVK